MLFRSNRDAWKVGRLETQALVGVARGAVCLVGFLGLCLCVKETELGICSDLFRYEM